MKVEYLETDDTDEGPIDWYEVDGVRYGRTFDDKILDDDGVPLANDGNARWAIERFVTGKSSA
jgi:hypothetical protein